MKSQILLLVFALTYQTGWAQSELDLQFRFGSSTKNYSVNEPVVDGFYTGDVYRMRTQYDIGSVISYHYPIWKRFQIYATAGLEFSQSKHYLPIIDSYDRHVESVSITSNRFSWHLGIKKRFSFFDDKIHLDLGWRIVDRYPIQKNATYLSDFKFNNEDWIEYSYEIDTYYGSYRQNNKVVKFATYIDLNAQFEIDLSFDLSEKLRLQTGITYSRNNYFFYNYNYTFRYYYNGSSTPNETVQNIGAFPGDLGVLDHYLYLNAGLTYKFKAKKKMKTR